MAGGADLAIALSVRAGNLESGLRNATTRLRALETQARQTRQTVSNVGGGLSTLGTSMGNSFGALGGQLRGLVAVFTAGGLMAAITSAVQRVNQLADAAQQVGVSVEELQAIQIVFEEAGSSAQVAETALGRLGTLIGDAARDSKEAQETFVALGVSFRNIDGSARSTVDVFNDVAEKIRGARSEQEALSIAAQFFGQRGARAAVAAAQEMGGSVGEAVARYRELGLIVSTETAGKLDQLGTAFANLGRNIVSHLAEAVAAVTPTLDSFLSWLSQRVTDAGNIIRGMAQTTRVQSDPRLQELQNRNAAAQRDLAATQRRIRDLEAEAPSTGVFSRGRSREAIDGDLLAARQRLRVQQDIAETTAQEARSRRDINMLMASLPDTVATPPPATPAVAAPPVVTARGRGGATQRLSEEAREAKRILEQMYEQTRTPVEAFQTRVSEMWAAVSRAGRDGVPALQGGVDTVRRALLEYAETAAKSLRNLGTEGEAGITQLREQLEGLGQRLLESGAVRDIEEWRAQVNRAIGGGSGGGFWESFTSALTGKGGNQTFGQQMGEGAAGVVQQAFGDLFNLFDKVAEGSMKAGDAIKQFALNFVKSIAQMVAQAAAMRLIQAFLGGTTGGSVKSAPGIGGVKMAGGSVAGGYTYLVGERGPELFTAPGAGRIVPNAELGGGMQVVVNQNAPGVVVRSQQIDERTVMLAVNMSREQVAADFAESTRTGHGAYAEPLSGRYNVRRRL